VRSRAPLLALLLGCGAAAPQPASPPGPPDAALAPSECPASRPDLDLPLEKAGYEGLPIARVCVLGAPDAVAARARAALATKERSPFEAARVTRDIHAIFELGVVDDVEVLAMPSRPAPASGAREVTVLYVIKARPFVRSVTFEGATAFGSEKLAQIFPVKPGQLLDPKVVQAAIDVLVSAYVVQGYGRARATLTSALGEGRQAAIVVHVEEGPLLVVRHVDVEGLQIAKREDVLRAMQIHAGATYVPAVYERDVLLATAYFYDHGMLEVKVAPKLVEDGDHVDVALHVVEGPVYRLGKISYEGVPLGLGEDPLASMRAKPKDVFNRSVLRVDIDSLKSRAQARGVAVDIQPMTELEPAKRIVNLVLRGTAP
jgi:outer membrane protein insertion porin family